VAIPLIVGRAGFEFAKRALKTKLTQDVAGVAAGAGAGLALSKDAQKRQKVLERERAATRKRKAVKSRKPRNRMGKRGTQSGRAGRRNSGY